MIASLGRTARAAAAATLTVAAALAQQAAPRPQPYVIKDVRLEDRSDAPRVHLVLRDGRIERIAKAGDELPAAARAIDGKGMLAVPAFLDAFTQTGCETPTPTPEKDMPRSEASDVQVDMRDANRKGVQPAFRASQVFALPKDKGKALREAGFGAVLSAPTGQLLGGTSTLATTREAAVRDTILMPDVFGHAAFRAGGGGYPGTLMGYWAQMRQFFLDVQRHATLERRYQAGKSGPRPSFDVDLAAGMKLSDKSQRLMCEAQSAQDILRWIKLGDELGLAIGIVGGREAYKVAQVLKERSIPLVLTLEWGEEPKDPDEKDKKGGAKKPKEGEAAKPDAAAPEEPKTEAPKTDEVKPDEAKPEEAKADEKKPDDKKGDKKDPDAAWKYEEPLEVRRERRREWEERRDAAIALHKAGVEFSFGSAGESSAELLKRVRTLVEKGLPKEVALAALTANPARLVGAGAHLGALQSGADATFAVWNAHPLTKDAKLAWLFVDGFANEFEIKVDEKLDGKPDEGVDASGTWAVELKSDQGTRPGTLVVKMTPEGEISGTYTTTMPDGGERTIEVEGRVAGKTLSLTSTFSIGETEVQSTWKVELAGEAFTGTATTKGPWGENVSEASGVRKPGQHEEHVDASNGGCGDEHP
jgi:imidazolonepropionase-like amidohydrolase